MGVLNRLAERRGVSIEAENVPLTSTVLLNWFGGARSSAGVDVTPLTAMGLTAYYRGVAILAGLIGGLEFAAERKSDRKTMTNRLMDEPHPMFTGYEWRELLMVHLLLRGNFYALKVRPGTTGRVERLYPLDPDKVRPCWVVGDGKRVHTERVYVVTFADGTQAALTAEDVFHVPGLGFDGLKGYDPISLHAESLGAQIAADRFAGRFFGNGTLTSGFLKVDKKLTEPQALALKERWQAKLAGVDNAHEVAVLDLGAEFKPLTIAPEQAQFLETREFGVREAARIIGVPPHLLMDGSASSNWGTGIEQQNMGLVMFTLRNYTARIEGRWTKELLPASQSARFKTAPLLKADSRGRFAGYTLLRKANLASVNECRAEEGLPPIDDPRADDPFWVPEVKAAANTPGGNLGNEPPPEGDEGEDGPKAEPETNPEPEGGE